MFSFKYNKGLINFLFTFALAVGQMFVQAQTVVNNGSSIFVNSGVNVVIGGDLINLQSPGNDGNISLDGNILLSGNFTNNASNNVFINIEPVPNGTVFFRGSAPQHIDGTSPIFFENVDLKTSDKELDLNDCRIYGNLRLDAILRLNSNRLIMESGNPFAINYVSKYILSETTPSQGYGIIQWNIGRNMGTYNVPFGSGLDVTNDLNVTLTTRTSAWPTTGSVSFATYHTDPMNIPYPQNVFTLNEYNPDLMADRFWYISPDFTEKPDIDIVFKYTVQDIVNNANIKPLYLKGTRYNPSQSTWEDMPPKGISDLENLMVTVSNISANDFFSDWALISSETEPNPWVPNTFTPNGDTHNDVFLTEHLGFEPITYQLIIFNRWGGQIYETDDIKKGWDGRIKGSMCPQGVYVWKVLATADDGNEYKFVGKVNLVR